MYTDQAEQLITLATQVGTRLYTHTSGPCRPCKPHPIEVLGCDFARTLEEARNALIWAIPLVGQDIETGDMVTIDLDGLPTEGWTLDGWCRCLHTDDYRPECVDHDLYQLTHKNGGVLLHVHRHQFTAA